MEVIAKKRFGQNFLMDKNIVNNIVNLGELDQDTLVIEIGPGTGNLTKEIVKKAGFVLAYEIDFTLVDLLNETIKSPNFKVINRDILEADIKSDISEYNFKRIVIMGNLPYYITTPIILGLLEKEMPIATYVFMIQDEVADRFTACAGKKDYNALSVLINYKTKAKKCFVVPAKCFNPAPKVNSAVITLTPKEITLRPKSEKFFFALNRAIFRQRRKTLQNNLLAFNVAKEDIMQAYNLLGFKPTIRSEELSLEMIIKLADVLEEKYGNC